MKRAPGQARNPYRIIGGKARLRPSVVAFLDILGSRELMRDAYEHGQSLQFLEKLRKALLEARSHLHSDVARTADGEAYWRVKLFTDNIVVGIPFDDDAETSLGLAFSLVGLYQYKLVQHGFFVRGGIAIGDLYMAQDVVFGQALLDAYDAESRLARDPRIVLAPNAVRRVQEHLCYYAAIKDTPHEQELLVDVDDQFFVDYLMVPIDSGLSESTHRSDLMNHKRIVESELRRFRQEPRFWSKYAWVANYHNLVCRHLRLDAEQYGIDPVHLQPHPRKLHTVYRKQPGRLIGKDSGNEVARKPDVAN